MKSPASVRMSVAFILLALVLLNVVFTSVLDLNSTLVTIGHFVFIPASLLNIYIQFFKNNLDS